MSDLSADQIGSLGELIAATALSRPVGDPFNRPLFRPTALGGKYPTADLLVDLLAADGAAIGFFLVQIKATYSDTRARSRLPISIPKRKFNGLVGLPVPTYLIGVDVRSEQAYVVAAHRIRPTAISSIPKIFNLAVESVRLNLFKEVRSFWAAVNRIPKETEFDHD